MEQLEGKTAVITGAASGMGRAFAERFARAGMNVVLADIEAPVLDEAVAEVKAIGVDTIGVVADVSDAQAVSDLASQAIGHFGRVNLVCNNAGVVGSLAGDRAGIDLSEWQWVLGVNLWGVVHGHQAFLPHLLEHGDGHIVNTASMAGHFPGHNSYTASKWAVVAITEGLYHQLQNSTVGVSCLCPGFVDTRIIDAARNRPEWVAGAADLTADDDTRAGADVEERREVMRELLTSGMAPADVANLVHDAVVSDQFWIFTDTAMVASLEPRFQSVLGRRNPDPGRGVL